MLNKKRLHRNFSAAFFVSYEENYSAVFPLKLKSIENLSVLSKGFLLLVVGTK
jgi:hypothetical protein